MKLIAESLEFFLNQESEILFENEIPDKLLKSTDAFKELMARYKQYKEKKPDKGSDWWLKSANYDYNAEHNEDAIDAAVKEVYKKLGMD